MASATWSESERSKKWRSVISFLLTCGLIMQGKKIFTGLGVNGQTVLHPVEALSSPSHIMATKGSSVWLHWNYTYMGDGTYNGTRITFAQLAIMFNTTSQTGVQILATKVRQNGILTLQSTVPAPFTGRAEVISSNSTAVIHGLQYNDSTYQFFSGVMFTTDNATGVPMQLHYLRPRRISITVNGIPEFIRQPPHVFEVAENALLRLTIYMDGNPTPLAQFRWPHLGSSSTTNVPSFRMYPFMYSAAYTMANMPPQFCGRLLQTTIRNSMGSSPVIRSTNVTVLLNLSTSFNLRAERLSVSRCIDVRWNLTESGACYVKYNVTFRDASGANLYSETGYNIRRMRMCNISTYNRANDVQLIVSFKSTSTNTTTRIPSTNPTRSTSAPRISTWMIHGVSLAVLCKYLITCLFWLMSDASC